jgi:hypothetical protein
MRHSYSWYGLFEIDLMTRQDVVVYTPKQGSTIQDINTRLGYITTRYPTAKIIFMTETVTGITHSSIAAYLCSAGVPELIAKIKELLGIA